LTNSAADVDHRVVNMLALDSSRGHRRRGRAGERIRHDALAFERPGYGTADELVTGLVSRE
jgi:hypothetical protein